MSEQPLLVILSCDHTRTVTPPLVFETAIWSSTGTAIVGRHSSWQAAEDTDIESL